MGRISKKVNVKSLFAVAVLSMAVGSSIEVAQAHHSFAAFDRSKPLQITGTIKEYRWTNPHTWLYVVVKGPNKAAIEYSFEGFTPVLLPRFGITRNKFKAGDVVTVSYFGRRDGSHGGQYTAISAAGRAGAR